MQNENFNPLIEAVVSIRHFAIAASNNWSTMKSLGAIVKEDMEAATTLINTHANEEAKHLWSSELIKYNAERAQLQEILGYVVSRIKEKSANNLTDIWNQSAQHSSNIETIYRKLHEIGQRNLPKDKLDDWSKLWKTIHDNHEKIKNEANASQIQLGLIEQCKPEEIDELTDTILKHIPVKYSKEEAHKYSDEYMQAYEDIKREASGKKNLWDRFLDLLAGGAQQTPAQRVMMQRWVNGEKGDLH